MWSEPCLRIDQPLHPHSWLLHPVFGAVDVFSNAPSGGSFSVFGLYRELFSQEWPWPSRDGVQINASVVAFLFVILRERVQTQKETERAIVIKSQLSSRWQTGWTVWYQLILNIPNEKWCLCSGCSQAHHKIFMYLFLHTSILQSTLVSSVSKKHSC